ncbi:MAG: nitroreductase family protein [Actinobacteria bacterium]|nr:nitroreductase family protein [Actinomycetota bacterium]
MDAAVRAPSGGNTQNWRFLLVDDPEVKSKLGPIYRQAMSVLWGSYYKDRLDAAHATPDLEESKSMLRVQKSAQWLADNFEGVPLYLFGFAQHDPSGSSVYPALWNAQLAARAEGVGTSLTLERAACCSRRRRWYVAYASSCVSQRRGARHPWRAEGRRLEHAGLRVARLSHGQVGRRDAPARTRCVIPQSVGRRRRIPRRRTALALVAQSPSAAGAQWARRSDNQSGKSIGGSGSGVTPCSSNAAS